MNITVITDKKNNIVSSEFINSNFNNLFSQKNFNSTLIDIHGKSDKENLDNIMIKPFLPKALVLFISGKSWYFLSKKMDLAKKSYIRNHI